MTHIRQSFLIPELNIVANHVELKSLQKRMLQDHYAKDYQQKLMRSMSEKKTYRNFYNPQRRYEPEVADIDYMKNSAAYNKSFGIDLGESYHQQILRKQAIRRQQKDQERLQQQHLINLAQTQLHEDSLRTKAMRETLKKQAQEEIHKKQVIKQEKKKQDEQQKQAQKQRYQKNMENHQLKQESFKQHFTNVNDAIQQNQQNYLSSVAPVNESRQFQKNRLVENAIKASQKRLRQQLQHEYALAEKHRSHLRDSLVLQIKHKEEKKKQEIQQMRNQGYTSEIYTTRHHPINNPVDFKISHDNRYIINELRSGLARSGSHSLL